VAVLVHGKTVLLKLMLLQCIKKNAQVYIADFKGGIDYKKVWHEKCTFVTDESELLGVLTGIIHNMEHRTEILKYSGYTNIDDYNATAKKKLQRIIFAFDEVAEVLDKKGLSKDDKEF
jgi:S-DNA-T family DNA segregation ATPase FtsK/SpoIIIE